MIKLNRDFWRRFTSLASPYWRSNERWTAWGLLIGLILLMLGQSASCVLFTQQTGEFASALAAKDAHRFWRTTYECLAMLAVSVPIYGLYYFVRDKLGIHWRRWLTRDILSRYFSHRAYYKLNANAKIDNPDQRIGEDVGSFTQNSLAFLLIFLGSVIQVAAYSGVLWTISWSLVCFLIIYAVVGTLVTTVLFGRPLIGLNFLQLKKEADFRFGLIRVRENAESIALYRGERQELIRVEQRFQSVFENYCKLINRQLPLNLFANAYNWLTSVIPYAIIANRVLSGELEVGRAVQAAGAFTGILAALTIVIDQFDRLSKFAAGLDRLDSFVAFLTGEGGPGADGGDPAGGPFGGGPTLEVGKSGSGHATKKLRSGRIRIIRGKELAIDRLSLRTLDDQRSIVNRLSFVVRPGEGLMIVGPSGSGKSSLLRAIAGLMSSGAGTIARPRHRQMMFLPQKPYMIVGTLREQLLYPLLERFHTDDELLEVLDRVNLPRLADQLGGLDSQIDWANSLSVGEQQRLAFARVLIARPQYAMLDEATSALDAKNEDRLYHLLGESSTTCVSVSHHESLRDYHQHVLELFGDGRWQHYAARQYVAAG
jgi:vitamin B12/bleomycin/antimicrobial peptide transport system ATP-binding/permease protein